MPSTEVLRHHTLHKSPQLFRSKGKKSNTVNRYKFYGGGRTQTVPAEEVAD